MKNKKIVFLSGLPASGKSTYAKELVAKGYKRVNKDDLRAMVDNSKWSKENEEMILDIQDRIILLSMIKGRDIVVDNTNFEKKHLKRIEEIVSIHNAIAEGYHKYEIEEKFIDTPVEECIRRDALRPNPVGQKVIYGMYNKYLKKDPPVIEFDPKLPKAIIVDVDGTLAKKGDRDIYDGSKVYLDTVIEPIKDLVERYADTHYVLIMSGRDEEFREVTEEWLRKSSIPYHRIYMRKAGDRRKDSIVKNELYRDNIKGNFNISVVVDDRKQVVDMWRGEGLLCLQCAEGNF